MASARMCLRGKAAHRSCSQLSPIICVNLSETGDKTVYICRRNRRMLESRRAIQGCIYLGSTNSCGLKSTKIY